MELTPTKTWSEKTSTAARMPLKNLQKRKPLIQDSKYDVTIINEQGKKSPEKELTSMTSHGRQWEELWQQICKRQYGAATTKKDL